MSVTTALPGLAEETLHFKSTYHSELIFHEDQHVLVQERCYPPGHSVPYLEDRLANKDD